MVPWLPALKSVLPYVTQVVSLAIPAFTKPTDNTAAVETLQRQISELQEAATHNAEAIKTLAAQLAQVINGIEAGSAKIEKDIRWLKRLCLTAIALALSAILLWFFF